MTFSIGRIAADLSGAGGGQLEKLTINYDLARLSDLKGALPALFNPAELNYSRHVTWEPQNVAGLDADVRRLEQQWRTSSPITLSLDLLFDTYTGGAEGGLAGALRGAALPVGSIPQSPRMRSVREYTDVLNRLADASPALGRPPTCSLTWGRAEIFRGVLASLNCRFTMFLPDGTPVRATVSCSFSEAPHITAASGVAAGAVAVRTRTVRRGDTLQKIAAEEYGDPGKWRVVARANGIANPSALAPGTTLKLPRLL